MIIKFTNQTKEPLNFFTGTMSNNVDVFIIKTVTEYIPRTNTDVALFSGQDVCCIRLFIIVE